MYVHSSRRNGWILWREAAAPSVRHAGARGMEMPWCLGRKRHSLLRTNTSVCGRSKPPIPASKPCTINPARTPHTTYNRIWWEFFFHWGLCGNCELVWRTVSMDQNLEMKVPGAKIAPSMLSSDFANLASEAKFIQQCGADWLHMDIMVSSLNSWWVISENWVVLAEEFWRSLAGIGRFNVMQFLVFFARTRSSFVSSEEFLTTYGWFSRWNLNPGS